MNAVFHWPSFWQPYFTLEWAGLAEADLLAQLEQLRPDHPVREEIVKTRSISVTLRSVEFAFNCGGRFSLIIKYSPNVIGGEKHLVLEDASRAKRFDMGWWDLARWHPYCLRPEELDLLLRFWERYDARWDGPEVPLLLLCEFVGLADAPAVESLQSRAKAAYDTLMGPETTPSVGNLALAIPEDGYRWELDKELGWVFTSDEYCCYSIRNRAHADGGEGLFPFVAFREMMAEVQARLDGG